MASPDDQHPDATSQPQRPRTLSHSNSFPSLKGPPLSASFQYNSNNSIDDSRSSSIDEHDDPFYDEDDVVRTPSAAETYSDLRRNLSFKGLKDLHMTEVQRHVWRPPGQGKPYPTNLDRLIVHTVRGAVRAFVLAYSVRAGVNIVLVFFSTIRSRKLRWAAIRHALFGEAPIRFGAMFATFAALWRWMYNGLRIYNPGNKGKGKTENWHAPLAGAVAGLAVLAEKGDNRTGIAQQVFVRGLQGIFNAGSHKGIIRIPHGDILTFGFACSRIMYAWLLSPETLPPGYGSWISKAGNISKESLQIHLSGRYGYWPLSAATNFLQRDSRHLAPKNRQYVQGMLDNAIKGDYGTLYMPCAYIHPEIDNCLVAQPVRAINTWKVMLPVYSALHFIPPILFRRKAVMKDFPKFLKRSSLGTARSCSFLTLFIFIYMGTVCVHRNLYDGVFSKLGPTWRKIWLSKHFYWMVGFATCLSLFAEEKKRRAELALYVLPKALESYWKSARARGYVPYIPHGELLLASSGLAMVMSSYAAHPEHLSGLVRALLYQFIGKA